MARCSNVFHCNLLLLSASMVHRISYYMARLFVRFVWLSTAKVNADKWKSSGGPTNTPCGVPTIYLAHGRCDDKVLLVLVHRVLNKTLAGPLQWLINGLLWYKVSESWLTYSCGDLERCCLLLCLCGSTNSINLSSLNVKNGKSTIFELRL